MIFDLLTSDGKVTATHADPSNEMQAFEVEQPSLRTEATDAADGDHTLLPSLDSAVTDTVSYGGLMPEPEYVMSGTLVNKADGKPCLFGRKAGDGRRRPSCPSRHRGRCSCSSRSIHRTSTQAPIWLSSSSCPRTVKTWRNTPT